jgi:uncharacterized membrane protein YfcA
VQVSEALLLAGGGLVAGVVNTLAGGGSLLTVPLLVLTGLPGTLANGTNRVGVLLQTGFASLGFRAQGVGSVGEALPVLLPSAAGAVIGAAVASHLPDAVFERVFGVLMLVLLVPLLRGMRPRRRRRRAPPWLRGLVFFGIGLYAGSFQAGTGFLLLFALSFGGFDLVKANSIKVLVAFCFVVLALPVFLLAGEVAWPQALCLGSGFAVGGAAGSRIAVRGGEKVIRPVLAVTVVALALRMIGVL